MSFYNEKGLKRFVNAILFSIVGFKATWKHEEAFRQEVIGFLAAIPVTFWLAENNLEILLLLAPIILIMIVEILNSAIEAIVDRAGNEYHELAGRAKDMGSAAVMLTIMLTVATWVVVLF
jgi:diacylglycerol kinase (ATP)